MDSNDPPRKNYGLKPRQFEKLNSAENAPEKSTGHDVQAMLQQNRSVEKEHGKDKIEIREKRKSRRKQDYWLVVIGGNLLILGIVAIARFNIISLIFGGAGMIVITLSFTWVMWFVLDDY